MVNSMRMATPTDVHEEIKDTTVERIPFENAVRKLLKAPPKPKAEVSAEIAAKDRHQPLTRRILEP